jgi:hypothetical protein
MSKAPKRRWTKVLLLFVGSFFAVVPFAFIAYGAAGGLLGGLLILGGLAILQWPILILLRNRSDDRNANSE